MKRSARKKKVPLWEKIQLEKKRKKATQLGLIFFLLLFFVLFGKVIRSSVRNLTVPLESGKCLIKRTDLDKANRVNIVFDGEFLLVFSLDKRGEQVSILLVPEDFYIKKETEVYRMGSFFELGEMRDGCGGKFLKRALTDFLAVPVDRYIKMGNEKWEMGNEEEARGVIKKIQSWKWFLGFLVNFREIKKGFKTDLSLFEVFKLWRGVRRVRFDRIFLRDLEKRTVALDDRLLDGTVVKTVDSSLLHEEISSFFKDSRAEKEGIKVEILNATREQGLGQKAGLLVTHFGTDLIRVGNWPEPLGKTQIWLLRKRDKNFYTVQRLAEVFGAEVFVKPEIEEARGDIRLLLGENYSESY